MDMDAQACQQKETTHAHDIDAHRKRLSAELLVTSRNHAFGPVLLARELGRKRKPDKTQSEKQIKWLQEYITLCTKIYGAMHRTKALALAFSS